jgi:hypothetical protein
VKIDAHPELQSKVRFHPFAISEVQHVAPLFTKLQKLSVPYVSVSKVIVTSFIHGVQEITGGDDTVCETVHD